jgi:eukaryotic-like serine/threonine-protein kinase
MSTLRRIDVLCDEFDAAWRAGQRPRIEEFVTRAAEADRPLLLKELIAADIEFRGNAGEHVSEADYQAYGNEAVEQARQKLNERAKAAFEPAPTLIPAAGDQPSDAERLSHAAKRFQSMVGPFKILQPIAEGGMGSVYMAEQEKPVRRRVALKVIKADVPSKEVLARFEAERQALAMMDHQNIAKVLDAGVTDDGRPYFAMELVKGIPITKYCDQNKLTPNERLELFVQVCRAIQHAHQKGIIHRDIKPSNVLVSLYDGKPVAKVIDFGLAKALQSQLQLSEKTMFTQFGQVVGTLEYMSPEQAEMNTLDVDTRTDVYSLGVLLYELLTGSTPIGRERLKSQAFDRILQLIREEEVPRPSIRLSESGDAITGISEQRKTDPRKLSLILKGDLDWIALRALEKDRTRRYDGAASLADDVVRYLHDEPIVARPPSLLYRVRKAVRRYRAAFVTSVSVLLLLVAGLVATGMMWFRAVRAERDARTAERDARLLAQSESDARLAALQLAERSRLLLYGAHMNLAGRAWNDGHTERMRSILDRQTPAEGGSDIRGFEWYYLNRRSNQHLMEFKGTCAAFAPHGRHLAVAGHDGMLRVIDVRTGEELQSSDLAITEVIEHKDAAAERIPATVNGKPAAAEMRITSTTTRSLDKVFDLAFSPDGELLAAARGEGSVTVFDAHSLKAVQTIPAHNGLAAALAFSADGSRLATGGDDGVRTWESRSGVPLEKWDAQNVCGVAFSADGKRLAYSEFGGAFSVVDADSRHVFFDQAHGLTHIMIPDDSCHIAFSHDGRRFVAPQSGQSSVKVYSVDSGEDLVVIQGHDRSVRAAAFSPDDEAIATASDDRTIRLWNSTTGQNAGVFRGHASAVRHVTFSPNGHFLLSRDADGSIRLWDAHLRNDSELKPLNKSWGSQIQFVDGDWLHATFAGSVLSIREWSSDVEVAATVIESRSALQVALSPGNRRVAFITDSGDLQLWNMKSSEKPTKLCEGLVERTDGGLLSCPQVLFSVTGRRLALFSDSSGVHVWDTDAACCILHDAQFRAQRAVFSPDENRIAYSDGVGEFRVRDVSGQTVVVSSQSQEAWRLAFDPGGDWLAGTGFRNEVRIFRTDNLQRAQTLIGHKGSVEAIAYSPNGDRLASAGADQMVKIWDPATGEELFSLDLDGIDRTLFMGFSPDGRQLAVQGLKRNAGVCSKIWDARPWTPELRIEEQALNLVRFYLQRSEPPSREKLSKIIESDEGLNERVRIRAIKLIADGAFPAEN